MVADRLKLCIEMYWKMIGGLSLGTISTCGCNIVQWFRCRTRNPASTVRYWGYPTANQAVHAYVGGLYIGIKCRQRVTTFESPMVEDYNCKSVRLYDGRHVTHAAEARLSHAGFLQLYVVCAIQLVSYKP